jgi:hypothetical protein
MYKLQPEMLRARKIYCRDTIIMTDLTKIYFYERLLAKDKYVNYICKVPIHPLIFP